MMKQYVYVLEVLAGQYLTASANAIKSDPTDPQERSTRAIRAIWSDPDRAYRSGAIEIDLYRKHRSGSIGRCKSSAVNGEPVASCLLLISSWDTAMVFFWQSSTASADP